MHAGFWPKKIIILFSIVIILLLVDIGLLFYALTAKSALPANSDSSIDRIYTVTEALETLATQPELFQDRSVLVKGTFVDGVMGTGCTDYLIMVNEEDTQAYNEGTIVDIPSLLTGSTTPPDGAITSGSGVFRGHFYDQLLTQACHEGWQRFVLEKQIIN